MANRYALRAGNWSDLTIWDGGTLPGPGDTVRPNAFSIIIDQNIDVALLTNNAVAPAALGGGFTVPSVPVGGLTITAAIAPTTLTGFIAVTYTGPNVLTINGDMISGAANAACMNVSGTLPVIVNGNVTAGTGANSYGISVTGAGSLTVNGDVSASGSVNGILSATAITLVVNGNVSAGAGAGAGITLSVAVVSADINGSLTAGTGAPALRSTLLATSIRVKGPLFHASNGRSPIVAPSFMFYSGVNTQWTMKDDSAFPAAGADVLLQVSGASAPPPADVRAGVVYGPDGTLVGELSVPPRQAVAAGVPVDDTTGTAALTLDSGVATVASTGAQLAAIMDV